MIPNIGIYLIFFNFCAGYIHYKRSGYSLG
nr:MAG TPA: Reaction center protein H chain, membrane protein, PHOTOSYNTHESIS [Caudoviricetes sp.]